MLMQAAEFDRDSIARWYATEHLSTDPGIAAVHYLPANADEREIRLVEVNHLIGNSEDELLEPIDFGVDSGTVTAHRLCILDVTPDQWERINQQTLSLPGNWSLDGAVQYGSNA
ncbi:MAG: hypothetical protein ACKV0T_15050 [Planctomycetales bacterium]